METTETTETKRAVFVNGFLLKPKLERPGGLVYTCFKALHDSVPGGTTRKFCGDFCPHFKNE